MSEKNLNVSGKEFDDLTETEMQELAGGQGDVDPEITPGTVVITSYVTGALSGAVASYVASAAAKC